MKKFNTGWQISKRGLVLQIVRKRFPNTFTDYWIEWSKDGKVVSRNTYDHGQIAQP